MVEEKRYSEAIKILQKRIDHLSYEINATMSDISTYQDACIEERKNLQSAIELLSTEKIASGKYYYDPNRMGMHFLGNTNIGDLLFLNKDKYNNKEIDIRLKEKR